MYFIDYNRYNIRKLLKNITKKNPNYFNNNNVIYINKNNTKNTNVYTAIDVLEEFIPKIFDIIDFLDTDNLKIYNKLKNIFNNYDPNKLYIILGNNNILNFKRNFFKYLNNLNIHPEEKQNFFNFLNKINLIVE